jgi:hypothetical protein
MTQVILEHNGDGAVNRVDVDATAFGYRDHSYILIIMSLWPDPVDSDRNLTWTRRLYDAVKPSTRPGVYVNYLGEEGQDRVKEAYGNKYQRLVALKNKYNELLPPEPEHRAECLRKSAARGEAGRGSRDLLINRTLVYGGLTVGHARAERHRGDAADRRGEPTCRRARLDDDRGRRRRLRRDAGGRPWLPCSRSRDLQRDRAAVRDEVSRREVAPDRDVAGFGALRRHVST